MQIIRWLCNQTVIVDDDVAKNSTRAQLYCADNSRFSLVHSTESANRLGDHVFSLI
jgi:hypothetical protein